MSFIPHINLQELANEDTIIEKNVLLRLEKEFAGSPKNKSRSSSFTKKDKWAKAQITEQQFETKMKKYKKLQKYILHVNPSSPKSKQELFRESSSLDHFFRYGGEFQKLGSLEIIEKQEIDENSSLLLSPEKSDGGASKQSRVKNGSFLNNFGPRITKQTSSGLLQEKYEKQGDSNRQIKNNNCISNTPNNNNENANQESNPKSQKEKLSQSDVVQIGGRQYRKKYNMEFKMQLRRKSCYCTNCGNNTRYENKHQNIVNSMLIRRRKNLNKVIKVVNFLNSMNKAFKHLQPEEKQDLSPSKSRVSSLPQIENDDEKASLHQKAVLKNIVNHNNVQMQKVNESNHNKDKRLSKGLLLNLKEVPQQKNGNLKKDKNKDEQIKKRLLESQEEDNDTQAFLTFCKLKIQESKNFTFDSEEEYEMGNDQIYRKKLNKSAMEQWTKNEYDEAQKIRDAKLKKQSEEVKFVGKTPLDVLFKVLSQGKRESIFDKDRSNFRINKLINSKPYSIHNGNNNQINNGNRRNSNNNNSNNNYSNNSDQKKKAEFLNKSINQNFYQSTIHSSNDNFQQESQDFQKVEPTIPPLTYFMKQDPLPDPIKERELGFVLSPVSNRGLISPFFATRQRASKQGQFLPQQHSILDPQDFNTKLSDVQQQEYSHSPTCENFKVTSFQKSMPDFKMRPSKSFKDLAGKEQNITLLMKHNMANRLPMNNFKQIPHNNSIQNIQNVRTYTSNTTHRSGIPATTDLNRGRCGLLSQQSDRILGNKKYINSNLGNQSAYNIKICQSPCNQINQSLNVNLNNNNNIHNKTPQNLVCSSSSSILNKRLKGNSDNSTSISKFTPYLNQFFSHNKEQSKSPDKSTVLFDHVSTKN